MTSQWRVSQLNAALSVKLSWGGCSSGCLVTSAAKHASACISHHITHHSSQHYANDFINRWILKTFSEWNKKADTFIPRVNDNFSVFITFWRFCSPQLPTKLHTLVGFSQSGSTIRSRLGPRSPRICINCHCEGIDSGEWPFWWMHSVIMMSWCEFNYTFCAHVSRYDDRHLPDWRWPPNSFQVRTFHFSEVQNNFRIKTKCEYFKSITFVVCRRFFMCRLR